ncbi:hypothetical protein PAL_GLEAN10009367 [Pteropus alecto]|uniref:Uncharacterized protein n=1 Tax=Pteropus alecto TaxID=9402 RepID=L5KW22_PTEAL|nr:hypothetical protein PAL_GLEAN10009367 [Pteropus alecto]
MSRPVAGGVHLTVRSCRPALQARPSRGAPWDSWADTARPHPTQWLGNHYNESGLGPSRKNTRPSKLVRLLLRSRLSVFAVKRSVPQLRPRLRPGRAHDGLSSGPERSLSAASAQESVVPSAEAGSARPVRVVPRPGQEVALWLHAPTLQQEPQTATRSRDPEGPRPAVQGPRQAAAPAAGPRGDRGWLGDPSGPLLGTPSDKGASSTRE